MSVLVPGNPNYVWKVCVSSWAPFNFYDAATDSHRGYEWDLFKAVWSRLGWQYEEREADSWDAMLGGLVLPLNDSKRCDISPSAIPFDDYAFATSQSDTYAQGAQITIPTSRGGFSLVTSVSTDVKDMWSFTRVFSPDLWALLVCSALLLAWLVWFSERNFHHRGMGKVYYPLDVRGGIYEAFYRVFGKFWNVVSDFNVVSIISKILSLAWGVATIVLIANYTAFLAGYLTAPKLVYEVRSIDDIKTKPAIAYSTIVPRVNARFGINLTSFYWMTDQDGLDALNDVRSGKYAAMFTDRLWLRYYTSSICDVIILDDVYLPNYLGWGVNKFITESVLNQVNSALMQLQGEGVQETLERAWLPASTCDYQNTGPIKFTDVAGLWVILAASLGLSLLLLVLPRLNSSLEMDVQVASRSQSMAVVRSVMSVLVGSQKNAKAGGLDPEDGPSRHGGSVSGRGPSMEGGMATSPSYNGTRKVAPLPGQTVPSVSINGEPMKSQKSVGFSGYGGGLVSSPSAAAPALLAVVHDSSEEGAASVFGDIQRKGDSKSGAPEHVQMDPVEPIKAVAEALEASPPANQQQADEAAAEEEVLMLEEAEPAMQPHPPQDPQTLASPRALQHLAPP